ncbi:hypothetical protein [Citrobacter amalonaticus]|uniref:hypothetical protein n=1 Tax=Citrobacter amalonaticus TaxID=35703 RepID=UPI0011AF3F51|nr:hypothetical protein [Citrobacter amalonaticus]
MKIVTVHVNSTLNFPNYLREILSQVGKPAADTPDAPVPPGNNALPPVRPENIDIPADPVMPPDNTNGPFPPAGTAPIINLSNIGNPIVHVDLGDKLEQVADKFADKLADKFANQPGGRFEQIIKDANNVYHIYNDYHFNIHTCQHAQGSSAQPHNVQILIMGAGHARTDSGSGLPPEGGLPRPVPEMAGVTVSRPGDNANIVNVTDVVNIRDVDGAGDIVNITDIDDRADVSEPPANLLPSGATDEPDGARGPSSVVHPEAAEEPGNPASPHTVATDNAHNGNNINIYANTNNVRNSTVVSGSSVNEAEESTDGNITIGSNNGPAGVTVTDSLQPLFARSTSLDNRLQFSERIGSHNAQTPAGLQAIPVSTRPVPPVDTFIAKQERSGGPVTLSQRGLLRPNRVGSDSASFTRQAAQLTRTTGTPANPKSQLAPVLPETSELPLSDNAEETKTFISTASIMLNQRNRELEFNNAVARRQQKRGVNALPEESQSENLVKTSVVREVEINTSSVNALSESAISGVVRDRIATSDDRTRDTQAVRNEQTVVNNAISSASGKEETGPQSVSDVRRTRPYSPYLDENGHPKSPVTLTVDGLHRRVPR